MPAASTSSRRASDWAAITGGGSGGNEVGKVGKLGVMAFVAWAHSAVGRRHPAVNQHSNAVCSLAEASGARIVTVSLRGAAFMRQRFPDNARHGY